MPQRNQEIDLWLNFDSAVSLNKQTHCSFHQNLRRNIQNPFKLTILPYLASDEP